MVWDQTYFYSPEIDPDLLDKVARSYTQYHAAKLEVPLSEMHAWWGQDRDWRDPLSRSLVIGWRSDWTDKCPKKCRLHA